MRPFKNLFAWSAGLAILSQISVDNLQAIELDFRWDDTFLDLSGGWRRDHLRSYVTTNDSSATDTIKADELNIYELGLVGRYTPSFEPYWCACWVNGFFIKGSAYWGWANSGEFIHQVNYNPADLTTPITSQVDFNKGDIHKGNTSDYSIGAGYLMNICGWVDVGPTGGYSYHRLKFKGTNVLGSRTTNDSTPTKGETFITTENPLTYLDNGAVFASQWSGPWAGFEADFCICDVRFLASWEYHWAHWKGTYKLAFADLTDCYHYSNRRHGDNGWGQEFTLDTLFSIWDCLDAGLGISYEYYHINTKGFKPDAGYTAVGCAATQVKNVHTTWHSFALTMDIGYHF